MEIGGKSVTIRLNGSFYGLLGNMLGKLHGRPKKVLKFTVVIAYCQSPAVDCLPCIPIFKRDKALG
jgi:hypothetical protein